MNIKNILRENNLTGVVYKKIEDYYHRQTLIKRQKDIQKYGEDTFCLVVNTLKDTDICYFPAFGTLLGLQRDGHLISHDYDIDFGVISEESEFDWEKLRNALEAVGFTVLRWFEHEGVVREMAFISPKSKLLSIDFFAFYNTEETTFNYYYARRNEKTYKGKNDRTVYKETFPIITDFEQKEYMGVNVSVPVNAEKLLEESYTASWRIPNPNWKDSYKPNCKEVEGIVGTVFYKQ